MADELFTENEDSQHGRYLTFTLDDDVFGISIRFIREIIGIQNITKVPETPDFIKGIINLRGKIISIIDVRLKFGKEEIPYTERTCVIVVEMNGMIVGLIVDKVDDVLTIPDEDIASAPDGRLGFEVMYIEGIGSVDDQVLLLLDLDKFLRSDEVDAAGRAAGSEALEAAPSGADGPKESDAAVTP
ncbi:MAG: chemotaxis protein CheW [Clostridiales Family XIII bacterium]|jgi:purine-binding chemotaxis protein CheW|nr:chemotaxis protein CheW [Clostridiales Family XIII bacterium]